MRDRGITFVTRRVDARWWRSMGLNDVLMLPQPPVGFRPFSTEIMLPRHGVTRDWVRAPDTPLRELNDGDVAVGTLLLITHDQLHAWSASLIARLAPAQFARIEDGSLASREALAFLHLVTEACAVVALDYWYLATVDFNSVVEAGSTFHTLTNSFHESALDEYRRHDPKLDVQQPSFFRTLTRFYCSGVWEGIGKPALRASPLVRKWLEHEIRYGSKQRRYIREYLAYAHQRPLEDASRAVSCDAPWQKKLLERVESALWARAKEGVEDETGTLPVPKWKRPPVEAFDSRCANLAALSEDEERTVLDRGAEGDALVYLIAQYLSSFDAGRFDRDKLPALRLALHARDLRALRGVLKGESRLPRAREPHHLMTYG